MDKGEVYDSRLAQSSFDAYMTEREITLLTQVVRRFFPNRTPRYLDFVCGTGRITAIVAPYAEVSYDIDVSESMVGEARRKLPETTFLVSDATRLLSGIEPFDLATTFRFVGNARDELRVAALSALNRLLRPGGLLVLNNHRNPHSVRDILHRMTGGSRDLDLSYFQIAPLAAADRFPRSAQSRGGHMDLAKRTCAAGIADFRRRALARGLVANPRHFRHQPRHDSRGTQNRLMP